MPDLLDDSYESDLTDQESTELLLMSEHAIAPPLSPGAQAVLDTTYNTFDLQDSFSLRKTVAAALRTAAEQVEDLYCADLVIDDSDGAVFVLRQLMLIAAELAP